MVSVWTWMYESLYLSWKVCPLLLRYLFDGLVDSLSPRFNIINLLKDEIGEEVTKLVEKLPERVGGAGGKRN